MVSQPVGTLAEVHLEGTKASSICGFARPWQSHITQILDHMCTHGHSLDVQNVWRVFRMYQSSGEV